ncbi:MAG: DUF1820 family protein [Geobacteraceae bacterium]
MAKKRIYKIIFTSQGKIFEIYARQVISGELYGFVEAQGLLFGERTTLLVDPSEEQLKLEFNGVNKTYIPFHSIVRIDEVEKEGPGKVLQLADSEKSGIHMLQPTYAPEKGPEKS